MELEVGMYVRTKDGYIDKIISIDYAEEKRNKYPNHPSKSYWRDKILLLKAGYWRTTQNIVKASHNLLGNDKEPCLIEVGDYVNGSKVKYICNAYIELDHYGDDFINHYESEKIKSIVTKEQFESMSYKVED